MRPDAGTAVPTGVEHAYELLVPLSLLWIAMHVYFYSVENPGMGQLEAGIWAVATLLSPAVDPGLAFVVLGAFVARLRRTG